MKRFIGSIVLLLYVSFGFALVGMMNKAHYAACGKSITLENGAIISFMWLPMAIATRTYLDSHDARFNGFAPCGDY